jgi:hypothetical protein
VRGRPVSPLGEGWDEGASRLPLGEGWGEGAPPLPLGEGWGEGRPFVTIKLAPNVPDIARIARAAVEAGADAITAVNTMPGMVIDAASGRPVLSNRVGGISGPALKPIALRAVYEIAQAAPGVSIIGTGGVSTGQDAAEMLMAGRDGGRRRLGCLVPRRGGLRPDQRRAGRVYGAAWLSHRGVAAPRQHPARLRRD